MSGSVVRRGGGNRFGLQLSDLATAERRERQCTRAPEPAMSGIEKAVNFCIASLLVGYFGALATLAIGGAVWFVRIITG